MNNKEFKKALSEVAEKSGFKSAFGGWFQESEECILALGLQKSNFGNYYELNINVFVQGLFGKTYVTSKELVRGLSGTVFRRQPKDYEECLILDAPMDDERRKQRIEALFREFMVPFATKALTRDGLKELAQRGDVYLLPAVKEELGT